MSWLALLFLVAMVAMHIFMHRGHSHGSGKGVVDQERLTVGDERPDAGTREE